MSSGRKLVFGIGTGLILASLPVPAFAEPAAGPLFYDQRRLPDMEVERRNQEVISEQRRAEEERRLEAEMDARRQADDAKLSIGT